MALNLRRELKQVRQDLATGLKATKPTDQFRSAMILTMVDLHVTASKITKTRSMEERRYLIREFKTKKAAFEKGIELLKQSREGKGDIDVTDTKLLVA